MSKAFKERLLYKALNDTLATRPGSKWIQEDYEVVFRVMEAYKRLAVIKRGADPVDGTDSHIDLPDSVIGEVMEHPYASKYSFLPQPNDEAGTPKNTGSSKKQAAAPKATQSTDTTDTAGTATEVQPVSPQQ